MKCETCNEELVEIVKEKIYKCINSCKVNEKKIYDNTTKALREGF